MVNEWDTCNIWILWLDSGYGNLNLTMQNLSDQAQQEECKQTEFDTNIYQTVDNVCNIPIIQQDLIVNADVNLINSEIAVNDSDTLLSDNKFKTIIREVESLFEVISVPIGDLTK